MTSQGQAMLKRLLEHPDAPRFNYATGDRLWPDDLGLMENFRQGLQSLRGPRSIEPPPEILERVEIWRKTVPYFRHHIPSGLSLERDWESLPTTSRADLALRPWDFVPDDQSLERLIIYRTAGTTGHPISVPHHPQAIRCYDPMVEFIIERFGAKAEFSPDRVACFLVGSQIRTYTYATVLYNWQGAGFAKINIRQTEWPKKGSQQKYFSDLAPLFLSGDPISFSEMMRMEIPAKPLALVTTSVAMSPSLKSRLQERYKAPVIDWYSMVETGPIGFICPRGHGYHILPHDIHVEVISSSGALCRSGEIGEIVVTGGRNPLFPLVRYRTGDFGRIDFSLCPCGDTMPRLMDLEGRQPVLIRSSDGTPVSTVDLSRLLREFPLLLHEFTQRSDRSCELVIRPLPGAIVDSNAIAMTLSRVLGDVPLNIRFDSKLGERQDGKAIPYRSELMVED